jgi:hypothetical protein
MMKVGDLIRRKDSIDIFGLFAGYKTSGNYEYAEVIWFDHLDSDACPVSSIQKNLIEIVHECSKNSFE